MVQNIIIKVANIGGKRILNDASPPHVLSRHYVAAGAFLVIPAFVTIFRVIQIRWTKLIKIDKFIVKFILLTTTSVYTYSCSNRTLCNYQSIVFTLG